MLRILIVATLLFLVSATSAQADATAASGAVPGEGIAVQLQIGARVGAQAFLQPVVRASMPTAAMHRSINGAVQAHRTADGRNAMLALFHLRSDKPGLALLVSESVSLGLRYQYLRREDIRRAIAETAPLDEQYSSHNLVLRARWQF
jgi:opacity protein-like surface antigen